MIVSTQEGKVAGFFRTLTNPKLGRQAPELLGQVLGAVETSLTFLADKNGFLVEVGWPWETRVDLSRISTPLGSALKGELTSGFRYGVYRGVVCYGLNFGVDVVLAGEVGIDISTRIGNAGATLSASGSGYFRASFVGALDQALRPLLLGDVRVDTHINVRAEAHASLSKKITRWFRLRISINISASFDLAVSAALATALDSGGVGFLGDVSVSVSDKGYRMAGRIPFSLQAERIDSTKQALDALLPPSISELGRLRVRRRNPRSTSRRAMNTAGPIAPARSHWPGGERATSSCCFRLRAWNTLGLNATRTAFQAASRIRDLAT